MGDSDTFLREEETLRPCTIPENFADTGRCFNGMFRTRNLAEGAILALPIAKLIIDTILPLEQKIVVTAICAGGVLLFCIVGINGDSVGEFLTHLFVYNKKKRIAKYNPRVKNEAMPGYLTKSAVELPRDKIIRLLGEINQKAKDEEDAVSSDIYDPIYQPFFEDDLGVLETPDDLKSKKQLRKEAKERKKAEKAAKKQEKALAKEQARKEKEEAKKAAISSKAKKSKKKGGGVSD